MPTTYIANTDHYNLVLSRVASVKKSLWIGTADSKELSTNIFIKNTDIHLNFVLNRK